MSLEVKWYDAEHTILVATIAKDTTWSDYHNAVDQIIKEASQVNYRVDIIFHDEVGMPAGNPMPHLKQGISRLAKQPNIGLSLIAGSRGSSGFVRAAIEIVAKAFMSRTPINQRNAGGFAKTLEDAVASIYAARSSVPQSGYSPTNSV